VNKKEKTKTTEIAIYAPVKIEGECNGCCWKKTIDMRYHTVMKLNGQPLEPNEIQKQDMKDNADRVLTLMHNCCRDHQPDLSLRLYLPAD
jgi:hypothetical protein